MPELGHWQTFSSRKVASRFFLDARWADGALRPPQSIVRAWMHSCYLLEPRGTDCRTADHQLRFGRTSAVSGQPL